MVAPLLVMALGTAACGSTDAAAGSGSPAPSAAPTSDSGQGGTGEANKTPEAVVTGWVTQVLEGNYGPACQQVVKKKKKGTEPAPACDSPEATKPFESLHSAWAKPGIAMPPQAQVTVDTVTPKGNTAEVPDTAISVDGHTLRDLMMIGSTVPPGSDFGTTIKLRKHGDSWQISDLHMGGTFGSSGGTTTASPSPTS